MYAFNSRSSTHYMRALLVAGAFAITAAPSAFAQATTDGRTSTNGGSNGNVAGGGSLTPNSRTTTSGGNNGNIGVGRLSGNAVTSSGSISKGGLNSNPAQGFARSGNKNVDEQDDDSLTGL